MRSLFRIPTGRSWRKPQMKIASQRGVFRSRRGVISIASREISWFRSTAEKLITAVEKLIMEILIKLHPRPHPILLQPPASVLSRPDPRRLGGAWHIALRPKFPSATLLRHGAASSVAGLR